jgi:subtilisin family serine protease
VHDFDRQLVTDAGPTWIGADAIWNGTGTAGLPGTKGEGVVVGVIDTGINHDHPSFASPGPVDGYAFTNPKGRFLGVCDPVTGAPFCNNKLIGAWDFTGTTPEDTNGHGSHTASTSAGNVVDARLVAPTTAVEKRLSGVAPHANLITYKACIETCPVTALLAGINQAMLDGVDVINYSIGGTSADPWTDLDALAFRDARNAGIFVSASAGNDGPGAATIGSPADAPWVMTVAASTHNRTFLNSLVGLSGGSTPLADIHGKSITAGYGPAPIVYAGDLGFPMCGDGEALPTGEAAINPFTPGTFHGEIVVCDRGLYGRVEMSRNVMEGGAGGYVLANDEASGNSLIADPYAIPGVHVTYADGVALKAWLAGDGTETGTISGTTLDTTPANGDVMASFSSRGPNPATADVLKPDVTAPGVDVFAAFNTVNPTSPPEYNVISGTSMSSPHNTGSAALLRAVHPEWSPDEVRSAMVTTAFTNPPGSGAEAHGILKEDASTAADPFDFGGGRVDLRRAAAAGLVLDETVSNYTAADPSAGGDPSSLNLPALASGACAGSCSWSRVVTSTASSSVTWTASSAAPDGVSIGVQPSSFTIAPGATQQLTVTADVGGAGAGGWKFGRVVLTPSVGSIPTAHLTLAANKTGGAAIERATLHFHGNLGEGDCTGDGKTDLIACSGPTLVQSDALSTSPAASWKGGPTEWAFTGAGDRTIYDPSWVWCLRQDDPSNADEHECPSTEQPAAGPTTLEGPMTVEFWAQCAATCAATPTTWTVRLWADGVQMLEEQVAAGVAPTGVPALLKVTVDVPRVTAAHRYTLQLEPVFLVDQAAEFAIYYDSAQPCLPTAASGPCDSIVRLPVVRPDLVVQSATAAPSSATKGDAVKLDAVVRNDGTVGAPASVTTFRDGDTVLGTAPTPALGPGEVASVTMSWNTADAATGAHTITVTANADGAFREVSSANNDGQVAVTIAQLVHRLAVQSATASANPVKSGEKVVLTAVVANRGTGASPVTTTTFQLEGGALIGSVSTPPIQPGGTATVTQGWNTTKLNGTYRILVTADAAGASPSTGTLTVTVKGNKVKNGSFEESSNGSSPDGWTSSGSTSYDGQSASAGPGGSWTSEPVAVQPGSSYDLTAAVNGSGTVLVQQLSAAGVLLASVSVPVVGSLAGAVLTAAPTATQLRIVLKGGLTGTTTFDDVGVYAR